MNHAADEHWMRHALGLAQAAERRGEVPVGAVVVRDGEAVGEGANCTISADDPAGHAEIVALRAAGRRLGNYRLPDCAMYVTLEPCCMCAGAVIQARLARIVYGAPDPKTGADGGRFELLRSDRHNHRVEVTTGVLAEEAGELLTGFFRRRR